VTAACQERKVEEVYIRSHCGHSTLYFVGDSNCILSICLVWLF